MFKKLITCVVVSSVIFTAGCVSSVSSYKDVKKDGEALIENANLHAPKIPELAHIRYSDAFYVPELKANDQNKPSWFFEKSEGSYLDYTLEEVMRDELARRGVNIRYLDNLDTGAVFSLVHAGTIGELLDKISFATKYSYQIEGDLLTWSKFKTQEFDVSFLAGKTDYLMGSKSGNVSTASTDSNGNAAVTDSGLTESDEYISFTTEGLSVWDDLGKSLDLLKSTEGKYTINQATSSVLVKDFPDNVAAISEFLSAGNDRLTKTVSVEFQIIKFTATEGKSRALNLDILGNTTGGVVTLESAFSSLAKSDLPGAALGFKQTTGKFAGSTALINLLNQYGVVTEEAKFPLVTLNNQVGKYVVGKNKGFLAQSGGTSTANVGTETTLIPGLLKTGDSLYVLPNVSGDKITLQVSTNLSNFKKFRTVASGDRSIETPDYDTNKLFAKFSVRNGQTLLIGGNKTLRNEYTENSAAGVIALGGEYGGEKTNSQTLMLITPRIMNF